jgi:Protein of unknown function (DUF3237)
MGITTQNFTRYAMGQLWADLPPALQELCLRPLFILRIQTEPAADIGNTGHGVRRVVVVGGGSFEGDQPGLSGVVHSGGNDWISQEPDGTVHLDARIVLETREGQRILMSYRGIRHGAAETMERIANGEDLDLSLYYFRMSARFATASTGLGWLNRIVAVGAGRRVPGGVIYSVFSLL